MTKSRWGERGAASDRPFDAAKVNWVTVDASAFFFEPYCAEFRPGDRGSLVVTFGNRATRDRGVQVTFTEGVASVWVPPGGRVFWLPDLADGERVDVPWETRLHEVDPESGMPTES